MNSRSKMKKKKRFQTIPFDNYPRVSTEVTVLQGMGSGVNFFSFRKIIYCLPRSPSFSSHVSFLGGISRGDLVRAHHRI